MLRDIKVLDHGQVTLVDAMGDDNRICAAARVILNHKPRGDLDRRLIKYMMYNEHTSPFEHVLFTFYVKAPLFVVRQWQRHRTWSYNEMSGRYKNLPEDVYVPKQELIGSQATSNHQSRNWDRPEEVTEVAMHDLMNWTARACRNSYRQLIGLGCPRELARLVLPVAQYTDMYATVDLHNLMHFLRLRAHNHAQYEIRVYAYALHMLVKQICPVTMELFEERYHVQTPDKEPSVASDQLVPATETRQEILHLPQSENRQDQVTGVGSSTGEQSSSVPEQPAATGTKRRTRRSQSTKSKVRSKKI